MFDLYVCELRSTYSIVSLSRLPVMFSPYLCCMAAIAECMVWADRRTAMLGCVLWR